MEADSTGIDAMDRKILARLQRDATIQNQQLASEIGLSPSPCHRRVRALEEAGVIRGYVALLDGPSVGAGFLAYVDIRLERPARNACNTSASAISRSPTAAGPESAASRGRAFHRLRKVSGREAQVASA